MHYSTMKKMMRIAAKEQLNTPKKQSEAFVALQRKINDAWAILQEAEVMAETLQLSTDDKLQYGAYDQTARLVECIGSINNLIEDDLNVEPFDFTYQVDEETELTPEEQKMLEDSKDGDCIY